MLQGFSFFLPTKGTGRISQPVPYLLDLTPGQALLHQKQSRSTQQQQRHPCAKLRLISRDRDVQRRQHLQDERRAVHHPVRVADPADVAISAMPLRHFDRQRRLGRSAYWLVPLTIVAIHIPLAAIAVDRIDRQR